MIEKATSPAAQTTEEPETVKARTAHSGDPQGGRRPSQSSLDTVIRALEEDIIFGRLRPRERLLEDALMERFDVKRHVVRQALTELGRLGIVIHERNKGTSVRDFSIEDVENIYEVRALLQRHAAERIALPPPDDLIETLRSIHEHHSKAIEAGDLRAVYRLNNEFHDSFFGACGNSYLAQSIAEYSWLAHAIRSYRIGDPDLLGQARDEHALMIDALEKADRDALVDLCVRHINPSKEAYLRHERWP